MCEVQRRPTIPSSRYCCSQCRQHRWTRVRDENDLEMMLASASSEDPLLFDCSSVTDVSSPSSSRRSDISSSDVLQCSDGIANVCFTTGRHSVQRRTSFDDHSCSTSSGSGSGYNSEAEETSKSAKTSDSHQHANPMHLPVSRSALDPFPELSHSTPLTTSASYSQGCNDRAQRVGSISSSVPIAVQLLNKRMSQRPLYHSSESLRIKSSSSFSTLAGRHEDDKATWLPSGIIKTMLVVHFEDKSSRSVSIDELTKASDLAHMLADLQGAGHDRSWAVVECLSRFQLERHLEDHESVYQVHKSWSNMDDNKFAFRKDHRKYDFFVNPSQFFPTNMLDIKGSSDIGVYESNSDRTRNLLLQNLFGANARLPNIKGYLQMKEGKKSWKKYFFVLKENCLFYSLKGNSLETKHLVSFCQLNDVVIYQANNAKKTLGAPNNFCFCLKPTYSVTDVRQLKLLSADSEETRMCWVAALRIAKYGVQLCENFKKALRDEDSFFQSQYLDLPRKDNPLYVKERVAMDFSGQEGRVVGDPGEALGAALEEAYNWRRRVARMHKSPPDSSGTSPVNCFLSENPARILSNLSSGVHMAQPWFHGNISRDESCEMLLQQNTVDGLFLVRDSQSVSGAYVLSFVHSHKVKHCPILKVEENGQILYTLDGGRMRFIDLVQLIDFYQLNAAGLPTPLTHYVARLP